MALAAAGLAVSPLFEGLATTALREIRACMRPRRYAAGEAICREGATSDCLYLITRGVVEVVVGARTAASAIARLRRGDIFGEMGLLTGDPRSATVLPVVPVEVLQLDRPAFTAAVMRHPALLLNVSRVLARRQQQSLRDLVRSRRGEFTLLLIGRACAVLAGEVIAECRRRSPDGVAVVDLAGVVRSAEIVLPSATLAALLDLLDDWPGAAAPICVAYCNRPDVASLIRCVDRVALFGDAADLTETAVRCDDARRPVEVFRTDRAAADGGAAPAGFRTLRAGAGADDVSWIARWLTRTRLGLALGAGGAKGFAHVGVLEALEQAGVVVDYVAGSSIGSLVGGLMGLGMDAGEIARQLERIWSSEHVRLFSDLSREGSSVGLERVLEAVSEVFGGRAISDLAVPLSVVTADLAAGEPLPLREGPVHEAMRAALAIPGLAPPYRHGSRRLVDAVCLTPVPAQCVRDMGADIVVAVNLLSRQHLVAWSREAPPMPAWRRRGAAYLDPVVETLMMLQTDASIRSAAEADIVVTPRFVPSSWRDFHLAELFREAGRVAVEAALPRLVKHEGPPRAPARAGRAG